MVVEHAAVVARVSKKDDRAECSKITGLGRNLPLNCLDVVHSRLGLDQDVALGHGDRGIPTAHVAADGHRHFDPPRQCRREPRVEPSEQIQVATIANGIAIRIERGAKLVAQDGSDSGGQVDRERLRIASLRASDDLVTDANQAPNRPQAQARCTSSIRQPFAKSMSELATTARSSTGRRLLDRHGRRIAPMPYLPLTWSMGGPFGEPGRLGAGRGSLRDLRTTSRTSLGAAIDQSQPEASGGLGPSPDAGAPFVEWSIHRPRAPHRQAEGRSDAMGPRPRRGGYPFWRGSRSARCSR